MRHEGTFDGFLFRTAALLATMALAACSGAALRGDRPRAGEAVPFTLHVMSKCPFAAQVITNLAPVLEDFGPWVDFRMEFIGSEEFGALHSLHGDEEVEGDRLYACAQELLPRERRYMALVQCLNEDMPRIPENAEDCLGGALRPSEAAAVRACLTDGRGDTLLRASFARSSEAGVQGSPTLIIAGREYRGGRDAEDFRKALCRAMGPHRPKACAEIPAPATTTGVLIGDRRCGAPACDVPAIEAALSGVLPDLVLKGMDWSEEPAKELFTRCGLRALPAVLLPAAFRESEEGATIARHIRDTSDPSWVRLEVGATFDPRGELCGNGEDDDGNGLADCADPGCGASLECRPETPGRVEIFIMSQCPFAAMSLEALSRVLTTFAGDPVTVEVHYIGSLDAEGHPTSLHGASEVEEDIRQICVAARFPALLMSYLACRSLDAEGEDWASCCKDGIDAGVVEACVATEGEGLLRKDFELAERLGFQASPTWLFDGQRRVDGALSDGELAEQICSGNPGFWGCKARAWSNEYVSRLEWGPGTAWVERGDGPPVVLIHGFGDSKETWDGVAAALEGHFRVYAYDTLGFGQTPNPLDAWSVDAYVGQLHRFIEDLGIESPILVGSSMGAQIAVQYAETHRYLPEVTTRRALRGLVLVDPSGAPGALPAMGKTISSLRGAANPIGEPPDLAAARAEVVAALQELLMDDTLVTPDLVARYLRQLQTPEGRRAIRQVISDFRLPILEVLNRVVRAWSMGIGKEGGSPKLLLVWGAQDPWFPASQAADYEKAADAVKYRKLAGPDAVLTRVIQAAGHLPQLEKPDEVAAAILEVFGDGTPEVIP